MIPEPQRTYVLELLQALGPIADDFVVAGAQAMKFMLRQARATKDIAFVLDAVSLRGQKESVAQTHQLDGRGLFQTYILIDSEIPLRSTYC